MNFHEVILFDFQIISKIRHRMCQLHISVEIPAECRKILLFLTLVLTNLAAYTPL